MQKRNIYPSGTETVILLLLTLVAGIAGLPGYLPYLIHKNALTENIGEICVYSASFLITIWYASVRIRKKGGSFSINAFLNRKVRWVTVVLLVLCTVCLGTSIDYITRWMNLKDLFTTEITDMVKTPVLAFASLAILPAVLEEFLFRGVLLRQFLKRYSPVHAILLSAFCFAIIHVNPPQVIACFLSGCFLGWVYYRTNNIKYCILIHFINNAIAWLGLILTTYYPSNALGKFLDTLTTNRNACMIAAGITIICIMVLKKWMEVADRSYLISFKNS